jgi:tRNA (guanine37-N1)-methyltransferase
LGNPESLLEESHNEIGEVEYPVYTKPAEWRGLRVPEILTSGNHGAIAKWRKEQGLERTASLRGPERE